jgi:hypothetical protein
MGLSELDSFIGETMRFLCWCLPTTARNIFTTAKLMHNLITRLRTFYDRYAVALLLFFIFLFLGLLISPFLKWGIVLVAYYRRLPAFFLLYGCVILLCRRKILPENIWRRALLWYSIPDFSFSIACIVH